MCGYDKAPEALDFDHIDPALKSKNVGQLISSGSITNIFIEIRKCRILCANCHRIETVRLGHGGRGRVRINSN